MRSFQYASRRLSDSGSPSGVALNRSSLTFCPARSRPEPQRRRAPEQGRPKAPATTSCLSRGASPKSTDGGRDVTGGADPPLRRPPPPPDLREVGARRLKGKRGSPLEPSHLPVGS